MTVRAYGPPWTGRDTELAFKTRVNVKRLVIDRNLSVQKNSTQDNEASEFGVDYKTMMTHYT